jgi:hypothetical protein
MGFQSFLDSGYYDDTLFYDFKETNESLMPCDNDFSQCINRNESYGAIGDDRTQQQSHSKYIDSLYCERLFDSMKSLKMNHTNPHTKKLSADIHHITEWIKTLDSEEIIYAFSVILSSLPLNTVSEIMDSIKSRVFGTSSFVSGVDDRRCQSLSRLTFPDINWPKPYAAPPPTPISRPQSPAVRSPLNLKTFSDFAQDDYIHSPSLYRVPEHLSRSNTPDSGINIIRSATPSQRSKTPTVSQQQQQSKGNEKGKIPSTTDFDLLEDVPAWLRSLRLHKYTNVFVQDEQQENSAKSWTWKEMIELNDEELENMGVSALGARRKLLKVFELVKADLTALNVKSDDENK